MNAYYNEIEPYPAAWLRNLAGAGHIADGVVDGRSIVEVQPSDLANSTQCHFFAGLGAWSYALRLAGWPDSEPVWTGSCPCQPFSAAGRRGGFDDSRHLWPEWFRLIRQCRPPIVFGEQVASPDGLRWLDAVSADLEGEGYAVGAADLCAAGVGAPHLRQRLYFVAYAERWTAERQRLDVAAEAGRARGEAREQRLRIDARDGGVAGIVADPDVGAGRQGHSVGGGSDHRSHEGARAGSGSGGGVGFLGDADDAGSQGRRLGGDGADQRAAGPASLAGFWSGAEWIPCLDGKSRPIEPGTFPLAHGATARVGRLRAYGNAIVAPQAARFIRGVMESL